MDISLIQQHECKPTHISSRPQGVYQNNYFKDNEFIPSEKKNISFPQRFPVSYSLPTWPYFGDTEP